MTDTSLSPLVYPVRVAGLYELRRKGREVRLFGPDEDDRAMDQPHLVEGRKAFPHIETTTFAESWIEAKQALGHSPTIVQTRLIEGKLTYFELFGRFWTPDDLKEINRGKKYLNPQSRTSDDDAALLAELEKSLGPIPTLPAEETGLCLDGCDEGPGDREHGREECPLEGSGPRVHECGSESGLREELADSSGEPGGEEGDLTE